MIVVIDEDSKIVSRYACFVERDVKHRIDEFDWTKQNFKNVWIIIFCATATQKNIQLRLKQKKSPSHDGINFFKNLRRQNEMIAIDYLAITTSVSLRLFI